MEKSQDYQKFEIAVKKTLELEGYRCGNIVFGHHLGESFKTNSFGITDFTWWKFLISKAKTHNPKISLEDIIKLKKEIQNKIDNNLYSQKEILEISQQIIYQEFWQNQDFRSFQAPIAFLFFQLNYNSSQLKSDVMNQLSRDLPNIMIKLKNNQELSQAEMSELINQFGVISKYFYKNCTDPQLYWIFETRINQSVEHANNLIINSGNKF